MEIDPKAAGEAAAPSQPPQGLYKSHEKIYPKAVTGWFRTFKWRIMAITLAIYYLTPWIRWDRGEGQPDQAILVDLANRRFYFFFVEIWPQEFYYVAGLLIMAGVGLFLITSTVGRAWCGYFCPQTVWTDLYLHVERYMEGDRNAQIRLDKQPWGFEKLRKRTGKHAIFLLIAVLTGGAWVFYFADAPTLAADLLTGEASSYAYGSIAVLTFTTYSLGALMREQVCIYMCPWPRIQAAMLDDQSLTVTYHDWRGEPRGKHRKGPEAESLGDCIDCNMCVQVCPTGVDIRDGQQLGCITCGLCIDACDGVMEKVNLPKGLIGYTTLADFDASAQSKEHKHMSLKRFFRPRTLIYFGGWSLVGVLMLVSLFARDRLDVTIQHDRNPQFVVLSDGSIRNGYSVKILNMRLEARVFEVELEGLPGAMMKLAGDDSAPASALRVTAPADAVKELKIYVSQPSAEIAAARQEVEFVVDELFGTEEARYAAKFVAPERFNRVGP